MQQVVSDSEQKNKGIQMAKQEEDNVETTTGNNNSSNIVVNPTRAAQHDEVKANSAQQQQHQDKGAVAPVAGPTPGMDSGRVTPPAGGKIDPKPPSPEAFAHHHHQALIGKKRPLDQLHECPSSLAIIGATSSAMVLPNLGAQPGQSNKPRKRQRKSPSQIALLESQFALNPLPDKSVRDRLGLQLGLTTRQVQIWFQNRRAKTKQEQQQVLQQQAFGNMAALASGAVSVALPNGCPQQQQQQHHQSQHCPIASSSSASSSSSSSSPSSSSIKKEKKPSGPAACSSGVASSTPGTMPPSAPPPFHGFPQHVQNHTHIHTHQYVCPHTAGVAYGIPPLQNTDAACAAHGQQQQQQQSQQQQHAPPPPPSTSSTPSPSSLTAAVSSAVAAAYTANSPSSLLSNDRLIFGKSPSQVYLEYELQSLLLEYMEKDMAN